MKTSWLCTALGLASLLTACGTKKPVEETVTATTTAPATATPEPAAPAAVSETPVTTAAPATFDINAVPVSTADLGGFPYLSKLQGYKINTSSDSVAFEFDRSYVYDGKQIFPVEGRVLRCEYVPVDEKKKASPLMMARNYENLVKNLGGVQVFSGELPSESVQKLGREEYYKHDGNIDPGNQVDTYVIRRKDRQIWVQVAPGDYKYQLNVMETSAMPQQATALPAAELKKN